MTSNATLFIGFFACAKLTLFGKTAPVQYYIRVLKSVYEMNELRDYHHQAVKEVILY